MATIQERLQLKRVPLDTWNIREQLCLASAVVRSGDQNWMSVSRALKTVGEPNRPPDWYSQKSCAAQYGALLEHVETPKRKKRNSEGAVETPQESILKKLTQERIIEIQKSITEMNQQYEQLKNEITEIQNPNTSDDRLKDLWAGIEAAKRAKEREMARRAAWLKEREERRARADRSWRPQTTTPTPTPPGTPTAAPPSSPLLTSLLKSSPVVTTPQHISHPANVVETVSPSATAPTLSMLLEKSSSSTVVSTTQHESKHAAIEHIKNQLVQIEQQLIASTSASASPVSTVPLTPVAPAVDIDDIEIKEEDVYAFRDIDIQIPPVAAMHKVTPRVIECKPAKKNDEEPIPVVETPLVPREIVKEESVVVGKADNEVVAVKESAVPEELSRMEEDIPPPLPQEQDTEVTVTFPEVKFPTPEIKVIQSDDIKVKEEAKEPETEPAEVDEQLKVKPETEVTQEETPTLTSVPEEVIKQKEDETSAITNQEPEVDVEPPKETEEEDLVRPEDIPLPPDPEDGPETPNEAEPATELTVEVQPEVPEPKQDEDTAESKEQKSDKDEHKEQKEEKEQREHNENKEEKDRKEGKDGKEGQDGKEERDDKEDKNSKDGKDDKNGKDNKDKKDGKDSKDRKNSKDGKENKEDKEIKKSKEDKQSMKVTKEDKQPPSAEEKRTQDSKKDEDAEDSIPLKEMIKPASKVVLKAPEPQVDDDDTPMELSREEEKDGKKKRDYSRKRKAESRSSESANEVNAPESPSSNDTEKQHRLWKKSVMLVYSRLCAHKYASLFQRPITDEEAPDYSRAIRRPMDLSTIRRNIDTGFVRTTSEFQRDILLMLSNALMYNSSEHSVYTMAKEMQEEAECQLGMLLAAQAHAGLQPATVAPARRKRKGRPDTPPYVLPKRHREKLTP